MSIQQVLTALRFTTTQWVEVARCALRDNHTLDGSSLNLDQLEARVLYSATPLPVAEIADTEQGIQDSAPADDDSRRGPAGRSHLESQMKSGPVKTDLALLDQIAVRAGSG